ncbi:hypothetical protein [Halopiger djelfimassiliensis]|uniref:hypothetical protein n=1 Tax=Halopiger djelfimassiliensis TaxID=1293047 RepID=UPI000677C91A|nr:hypothetical protein [Halopiger djelfimassiliensis]
MPERADAVLAAIPLLAVSGIALRTAIAVTGVGTGLLGVPLAPIGYLAAFVLVVREVLAGPVAERADGSS